MSAHAYAPTTAPERERQPRLFALPGGASTTIPPLTAAAQAAAVSVPAAPTPALVPVRDAPLPGPAREARASRSLDAELRLAWTALSAGAPAACLMCGGRMEPLAHAAGGACTDCGTELS